VYADYKSRTPMIVPRLGRRGRPNSRSANNAA
jgi:hypothetical protein